MAATTSSPEGLRQTPRRHAVLRSSTEVVEDLENYVRADWLRGLFKANYQRTDGDVVEDPEITEPEKGAFLQMAEAEHGAPTLDLCRGQRALELGRRGHTDPCGVDR